MTTPKKASLSLKASQFFWVFVGWFTAITLGFGLFWFNLSAQQSSQRAIADVKQALATGDTRFVSVLCGTICVPGISDGQYNSLVLLHKFKEPIGIGDFILTPIQQRQQTSANEYGFTYNSRLLKYLLDNPDVKTRRYLNQVRQQLKIFQNSNPQKDALQTLKQNKGFLHVSGYRDFGYPLEDNRAISVGIQFLLINSSVLRGKEQKEFDKVVRSYVIPHNQELYRLLQQKWKQQGIQKGMLPS